MSLKSHASLTRAKQYSLDAFVLRCQLLRERDDLVTLFSQQIGKLRIQARGVRSPSSRLRSYVLTATRSHLTLAAKASGLPVLISASSVTTSLHRADSMEAWLWWNWISELIIRGMADEQPNKEVFELLVSLDHFLSSAVLPQTVAGGLLWLVGAWITLNWLSAVGLRIHLPESMEKTLFFDPLGGGFVLDDPTVSTRIPVPEPVRKVLPILLQTSLPGVVQVAQEVGAGPAQILHEFLANLAATYTDRTWRSLTVWPTNNMI